MNSSCAMLDAALSYVREGWHVFPARIDGKVKRGCTSGKRTNGNRWGHTNDPALAERYWRRWPSAAIGIPTGTVNGIFVVDVDTKVGHGVDGLASLQALEARCGALPDTRRAVSPTGSVHYYFCLPEGVVVKNSSGDIGVGIDVRGEGGMVIAPPSVREGKGAYRWDSLMEIAEPPPWLLDLVVGKQGKRSEPEQPRPTSRDKRPEPSLPLEAIEAMLQDAGKGLIEEAYPEEDVRLKLESALAHIPADLPYHDWFKVGCALHGALGDDGFALFDEWSAQSAAKYDRDTCRAKWIECAKVTRFKGDTVYWIADRHDPSWRDWHQRRLEVLA
ncbi:MULTISPECIES: bifunctional DNA primase/polymerase [unclassified Bradyrhizobium]|uniref:bifunctional DNA primase/polymerase n=1 Tax=unclassified Bradyrhizobium TaxID=2631580 RepID=UPI002916F6CF|nr:MULTISPECIES: bifunctional DNA primase/polymerase [unclassified Bradyrhizobium]